MSPDPENPQQGKAGDTAPEDAAEVRALVRDHLVMYHVATRRDLDDPATTRDFCPQVHGREGLRNLYLLTVADITTTSPTATPTRTPSGSSALRL